MLDVLRQIADTAQVRRFDRLTTVLGLDSTASMLRFSLAGGIPTSPLGYA